MEAQDHKDEPSRRLNKLIEQRRELRNTVSLDADEKRRLRISLGKYIQKFIRRKLKNKKAEMMKQVLADFTDLQHLTNTICTQCKRHIVGIRGADGDLKHERGEIAEIFATFYEELFKSQASPAAEVRKDGIQCRSVPPFTKRKIKTTLAQMKTGRAADGHCCGDVENQL